MYFLSLKEVIELHDDIIRLTGGSFGVLDLAVLESALTQHLLTFDGAELYATLAEKVAAEAHSIIANHPFIDGSKRIGHAVLETNLVLNGFELTADRDEQESFILRVASGELRRQEFIDWVVRNIGPLTVDI
ncbi:MAG: type II toxin-antitoxin system death-on-curing family toxin [Candidatus Hydrogenedentes bacterium]|nr:type II toxin-antitoxin system death-on-curing family toxin [Candidatus Hydrogenedentota bacterium]